MSDLSVTYIAKMVGKYAIGIVTIGGGDVSNRGSAVTVHHTAAGAITLTLTVPVGHHDGDVIEVETTEDLVSVVQARRSGPYPDAEPGVAYNFRDRAATGGKVT